MPTNQDPTHGDDPPEPRREAEWEQFEEWQELEDNGYIEDDLREWEPCDHKWVPTHEGSDHYECMHCGMFYR